MQRYFIYLAFDGTAYHGWQIQPNGDSVQQRLMDALQTLLRREFVDATGAGRTDAGVHALAQVAHFDLNLNIEEWKMREALDANLRDLEAPVSVVNVEKVDNDFHARFSAKGRGYIYRILNRRAPSVLLKSRVWWVPVPLDVEKMRQASKCLLGKHDFTSFRAAACQAKSPIKTLDKLEIIQKGDFFHIHDEQTRDFIEDPKDETRVSRFQDGR